MDISIKGIDTADVYRLSDLARSQGISRNQFIKNQLHRIAQQTETAAVDERYQRLMNATLKVISENTAALRALSEEVQDE